MSMRYQHAELGQMSKVWSAISAGIPKGKYNSGAQFALVTNGHHEYEITMAELELAGWNNRGELQEDFRSV